MTQCDWMDGARQVAAQCWCDNETKDRVMDPALAEAFARRLAAWMETAILFLRNSELYSNLLDECASNLGPLRGQAFLQDDGGISNSPIRLKIPALVAELANQVSIAHSAAG